MERSNLAARTTQSRNGCRPASQSSRFRAAGNTQKVNKRAQRIRSNVGGRAHIKYNVGARNNRTTHVGFESR